MPANLPGENMWHYGTVRKSTDGLICFKNGCGFEIRTDVLKVYFGWASQTEFVICPKCYSRNYLRDILGKDMLGKEA